MITPRQKLHVFLFSYPYKGDTYGMEVKAYSLDEARGRVKQMAHAVYDGEMMSMIKIPLGQTIIKWLFQRD
jgi:hypothetical protein